MHTKCSAIKFMFYCEESCARKIWSNDCCKIKGKRLIILYPTPHTCSSLVELVLSKNNHDAVSYSVVGASSLNTNDIYITDDMMAGIPVILQDELDEISLQYVDELSEELKEIENIFNESIPRELYLSSLEELNVEQNQQGTEGLK